MDMNYIYMIQMMILFLAVFFTFCIFIPAFERKTRPRYIVTSPDIEPAYLNFDILLQRQATYVYDKYQIWRYVLREKTYSILK